MLNIINEDLYTLQCIYSFGFER